MRETRNEKRDRHCSSGRRKQGAAQSDNDSLTHRFGGELSLMTIAEEQEKKKTGSSFPGGGSSKFFIDGSVDEADIFRHHIVQLPTIIRYSCHFRDINQI
jgi:hypothetical protein